jgi:hypothetical protein
MLERRRRVPRQNGIRFRSLLECILQRGIGIGADERRDRREYRYRERRTRPVCLMISSAPQMGRRDLRSVKPIETVPLTAATVARASA